MMHPLLQRCIAAVTAFAVLTGSTFSACAQTGTEALNLPQIGEPADAALTPAQEMEIGADVVGQMYRYDFILDDPELTEYLSALAWRVAAYSDNRPPQLTTFFVRDPRINAFALPGGYIGFNVGLLMASSNESEVAGVMAHELAHVTQRHIARGANDNSGSAGALAMFGLMLAAILAGSGDADAILGSMAIGQSALYQRQVNFTRAHEMEADRIGIQTMSAAGFNPEGMATFFQRLEQQSRLYGAGVPDILRTHPVNTTRVAEARTRIASMPASSYQDSLDYGLMQARARVLIAQRPSEPIAYFRSELAAGRDSVANRYGLALAEREFGNLDQASQLLQPLLAEYPRQASLNLLMADLEQRRGDSVAALTRLNRILDWYPRHAPVILGYADALIAADQPARAREVLLGHEQTLGTRPQTYRLLADAALALGNQAEASYQMASYHLARGDQGSALAQLDTSLRRADLPSQDRARLAAKRSEVREALPRGVDPYRPQSLAWSQH